MSDEKKRQKGIQIRAFTTLNSSPGAGARRGVRIIRPRGPPLATVGGSSVRDTGPGRPAGQSRGRAQCFISLRGCEPKGGEFEAVEKRECPVTADYRVFHRVNRGILAGSG